VSSPEGTAAWVLFARGRAPRPVLRRAAQPLGEDERHLEDNGELPIAISDACLLWTSPPRAASGRSHGKGPVPPDEHASRSIGDLGEILTSM